MLTIIIFFILGLIFRFAKIGPAPFQRITKIILGGLAAALLVICCATSDTCVLRASFLTRQYSSVLVALLRYPSDPGRITWKAQQCNKDRT
jgi:hypothetical protein